MLKSTPEPKAGALGYTRVFTRHQLQIVEAFRGPRELSEDAKVDVLQRAGTVETEDEILTIREEEVLRAGAEYVIFLIWNDSYHDYEVSFRQYGIYTWNDLFASIGSDVRFVVFDGIGATQIGSRAKLCDHSPRAEAAAVRRLPRMTFEEPNREMQPP